MTNVTQQFAAMVAACAIVLVTMGSVVTVPADNPAVAVAAMIAPELA